MTDWITARLPTAADADLHDLVRWDPRLPGMLIPWHQVRPGEAWQHSAAWSAAPSGARPNLSGSADA